MRRTGSGITAALIAIIAASACDVARTNGPAQDETSFNATISGAVEHSFQAEGRFYAGVDPRSADRPLTFSLSAQGRGALSGQSFQLYREGSGLPTPGRYALGLHPGGFRATYEHASPAGGSTALEAYAAGSGEVEITSSSSQRMTGTFRFSGFRYCARSAQLAIGPCSVPAQQIASAPQVEVAGSFSATPWGGDSILVRLERGAIDGYMNDGPHIVVPESVERGQSFTVRVTSYGDGCVTKGKTDVTVTGLRAEVEPYDYHAGDICTQQLVSIVHTANITFQERGTATIVFRGMGLRRETVTFERRVQVR